MQSENEVIVRALTILSVMILVVVIDFMLIRLLRRSITNNLEKHGGKKVKDATSISEKLYNRYHDDGWKLFFYISLPVLIFEVILFWILFAVFFVNQTIHWEFWTFPGEVVPFVWGIFGLYAIIRRACSYDHKLKDYEREQREKWKTSDYAQPE